MKEVTRTTSRSRTKMAYVPGSSLADPGKIHYAGIEMRDACVVLGIGVGLQIVDRLYIFMAVLQSFVVLASQVQRAG